MHSGSAVQVVVNNEGESLNEGFSVVGMYCTRWHQSVDLVAALC